MGRTVSDASGYVPDNDDFDPLSDDFRPKERSYRHFDLPLSQGELDELRASEAVINRNAFWPLLGFIKKSRRVIRSSTGAVSFEAKDREIKFSSHRDAALLHNYAFDLSKKYERVLERSSLQRSVLAYRKGLGSNIEQAKGLFDEIRKRGNVTAIALDVSGFFNKIIHVELKNNLRLVLEADYLLSHDFLVFKRMTKFEWVDDDCLKKRLSGIKIPKGRLCNAYQFRTIVRRHPTIVRRNPEMFGVPQGTSLSGLYANISMLNFDTVLSKHLLELGGSYRRYSDDIALLCPAEVDEKAIIDFVNEQLATIGLLLSNKKTDVSHFTSVTGSLGADKPFQYLGFTFDGRTALIRQSSLSRYFVKMKAGVWSKIKAAHAKGVPQDQIYMRDLFSSYTHFGRRRSFPRYAYKASKILEEPAIRRQVAKHFTIFKAMVREAVEAIYT